LASNLSIAASSVVTDMVLLTAASGDSCTPPLGSTNEQFCGLLLPVSPRESCRLALEGEAVSLVATDMFLLAAASEDHCTLLPASMNEQSCGLLLRVSPRA
jgi:hypothetical protein